MFIEGKIENVKANRNLSFGQAEKNGWNFIVICFKMTIYLKKRFLPYILNFKINRRFYG